MFDRKHKAQSKVLLVVNPTTQLGTEALEGEKISYFSCRIRVPLLQQKNFASINTCWSRFNCCFLD
jgi:hypothetical protein